MKRGPESRILWRHSIRVATAAAAVAATSVISTHSDAFLLCGGPDTTRLQLHRTQRQGSSLRRNTLQSNGCSSGSSSSSSRSSRASPDDGSQDCGSSSSSSSRLGRCRSLPPSSGGGGGGGGGAATIFAGNNNSGVGRRRALVAPLGAAAAAGGSDQPSDSLSVGAAAAAASNKGLQPGSSPSGVAGMELAPGRPREGTQRQQQQQQQHEGGEGGGGGRRPFNPITDETLDLIRASTSITEVIGQHVEMKPAGRGMIGCCPFHEDRTPSFSVDDSRGFYHCFGCGASGDVITFLMQMEGLGFQEVVRDLAEEAGISLGFDSSSEDGGAGWDPADAKARKEERERLSLVLQMAAQFYTRCLVEMEPAGGARAHIIERGISPTTVMDFQLGYSPADLTSPLIEYLDQEGFEMDTLVDAGLAPKPPKWKYATSSKNQPNRVDRFRGRLVVPIRDHRGLVIGFGARDLSDSQAQGNVGSGFVIPEVPKKRKGKGKGKGKGAAAEDAGSEVGAATGAAGAATSGSSGKVASVSAAAAGRGGGEKEARPPAKYLNSPETTLFKKGKNVFGLDLAKEAIRSEDTAFVVEGYFDVIKLHDAGIRCAVGVLGTAITIDQLQLCARYSKSKRVVLCMDADAAGQRAVERLCERPASSGLDSLSEAGVSVSVSTIPEDSGCKDPADFLQARGAEEFRVQVMDKAVPWSAWYGDRILAEHDFAGDANAFRTCTDRLTGFISDLSIPSDQTFHVRRFAKALAGGNEVMRHRLEFDLMNMSNEKRGRKNALHRRGSPSQTPSAPGSSTESWDVISGGKAVGRRGRGRGGGAPFTGSEGMEGVGVLRDHEWVMERVKMRKREESRLKREKYGGKKTAIWSPSMEQEYGGSSEESKATELALRGRILDQAQRFLLALVVHDPSRRATCAEEASRHGLSLGGERRQWLFNALTASASVSTTTAPTADGIADRAGEGAEEEALGGALAPASASAHAPSDDAVLAVLSSAADGWSGPSAEALAAGGDVLFEEVRAAAPGGYFGLRGVAAGMATSGVSWNGEGEEEETLDWAFEKAEADRVARGTNTDLVLLEVVMVMLKEQAAARMHSLSLELAETSNAVARTMAEAAAASLFAVRPPSAADDEPCPATAEGGARAAAGGDAAAAAAAMEGDGASREGGDLVKVLGGGRSRSEAQAKVEVLKARQSELYDMIQGEKEAVSELEAQRKAFTSRLPKIKAESEAIRNEEVRQKSLLAAATKDRAAQSSSSPSPPRPSSSPRSQSSSSAEDFHNERRQQQLHELMGRGEITGANGEEEKGEEGGGELTLEDFPYRFLPEDQEPEEGINIYDYKANIAAARAAGAAGAVGGAPPSLPSSPPPPQQQQQQQQLPPPQYHLNVPSQQSGGAATAASPSASATRMQDGDAAVRQASTKVVGPSLGHHQREKEELPPPPPPPPPHGGVGRVEVTAAARRVEMPPTPRSPPQRQRQQQPVAAASAGGGTVRAGANAGDIVIIDGGGGGGGDARGSGGGRRGRVPAATATAAPVFDWNTLSFDETPPAVTVLGGEAGSNGLADGPVMEKMVMEAEEQMEQVDEDDAFDGMMGW